MSCPSDKHEWRSIDGPTPPRSEDEPAWCRNCGALRSKSPFGGMGICHPLSDREAPTMINLIRKSRSGKQSH